MEQPFLFASSIWIEVKDGNDTVREIFNRHYSRRRYSDGRNPRQFVGPGQKTVLVTPCAKAIFIWRNFISDDGQQGINCAVFRNEGAGLSSELIREADRLADLRWPNQRHYTYVNSRKILSPNPGYCFIVAGWQKCGTSKKGLIILERIQK